MARGFIKNRIEKVSSDCTIYVAKTEALITERLGELGGLVVRASDSGARGQVFDPHSGRRVVSLSKTQLTPHWYNTGSGGSVPI